ncbi:MAG: uL15 family ribosomal protein [Candidatus Pacebacteria bacterium]|nr:uL15 family ribosomal protein [Candidatus Paceibacterota bacterium]
MQLHELRPIHKQRMSKKMGRGGAHGFYCGRGAKGQKARGGMKFKPEIRELIKRYPKLRGYKFKAVELKPAVLNVEILDTKFNEGEVISPKILIEKRLIRRIEGKIPAVKILGKGKIAKKLIIEGCLFSKSAKEKIEKAGGEIK